MSWQPLAMGGAGGVDAHSLAARSVGMGSAVGEVLQYQAMVGM